MKKQFQSQGLGMQRSRRAGFGLIETVIGAVVMVSALALALVTYLMGAQSWSRGEANISAQIGAQQSLQKIEQTLRQSMYVVVDANGQGLTYQLPAVQANGNFTVPLVWDGVTRRIALVGSNLVMSDSSGNSQVICSNVITSDPTSPTNAAYKIFTPNVGVVTRSLTIEVISQTTLQPNNQLVFGRRRDLLYLRNVQTLYQ